MEFASTFANSVAEIFQYAVRHHEFGVFGPAVEFFYQTNFIFAQRFAVSGAGILLMGGPVADVAVDPDQGWLIVGLKEPVVSLG